MWWICWLTGTVGGHVNDTGKCFLGCVENPPLIFLICQSNGDFVNFRVRLPENK